MATPDRENGMGHQQVYLAADAGKHLGDDTKWTNGSFAVVKGLIFGAIALVVASVSSTASYAQAGGPFAGMAGFWSGGGTVTLDDGSTERIRCRASYAVGDGGRGLNQTLTCASDSYKFDLKTNVVAEGGSIRGTWSEGSRNVNGSLEGRGANGNFEVVASAPGFNANISLSTRGNRQSVLIKGENQFRSASISLKR
jgi:hypothetical protein